MKTVGDYKNAGLELVEGDVCYDSDCEYSNSWAFSSNRGDSDWDGDTAKSFAWRTNTGEKPSFVGNVDVITSDKSLFEGVDINSAAFDFEDDRFDCYVEQWRPSLNQGEQAAPKKVSKPTYTKAQSEAGELPPLNLKVLWKPHDEWIEAEIMADAGDGDFVIRCEGIKRIVGTPSRFKPIPTEREKAIDSTVDKLLKGRLASCNIDLMKSIIGDLHDLELLKC